MNLAERSYRPSEVTEDNEETMSPSTRVSELDARLFDILKERREICAALNEERRTSSSLAKMDPLAAPAQAASYALKAGLDKGLARQICDLIVQISRVRDEEGESSSPVNLLRSRALRIDHVAIAVRDLEAAVANLELTCGFEVVDRRRVDGDLSGMMLAVMRAGGVTLVLCQGTSASSNVNRYIDAYGTGVQHLAIEVDDLEPVMQELRARGADMLTDVIHGPGLDQAFTMREPNTGMQFEFVSRTNNADFDEENVRKLFTAMERRDMY